jgi:hypothetical protein
VAIERVGEEVAQEPDNVFGDDHIAQRGIEWFLFEPDVLNWMPGRFGDVRVSSRSRAGVVGGVTCE